MLSNFHFGPPPQKKTRNHPGNKMTIFFSWAIKRTLSAFWRNFPYHFHHLSSAKGFSWNSCHQKSNSPPSESEMTSQPTPPARNSCFMMRFWVARQCLASYSTHISHWGTPRGVGAVLVDQSDSSETVLGPKRMVQRDSPSPPTFRWWHQVHPSEASLAIKRLMNAHHETTTPSG